MSLLAFAIAAVVLAITLAPASPARRRRCSTTPRPAPIVERLAAETARAVQDPEMRARFDQLGARLVGNSPSGFAQLVVRERASWGEVIKSAGIKLQ